MADVVVKQCGWPGLRLIECGLVRYSDALQAQLAFHAEVRAGRSGGVLMLVEHYPVVTLGRGAQPGNLLVSEDDLRANGIELVRTDRGGDVTYHGPGQLVGYPIVSLRAIGNDVHGFLRLIESVIVSALADFGVAARRGDRAGVWVGDKKICSIGIAVRGGVTYHGFALNVNPDMRHFGFINPCGLRPDQIGSLEQLVSPAPDMRLVRERVAAHFGLRLSKVQCGK